MNIGSGSQPTDFSLDVLGRYVCNTFDEAMANSDFGYRAGATDRNGNALPPRGDMRPFDFIIIGGGTFGAAVAEQLWFRSTGRSERILVLEAGPFFLAEHQQNLPSLGLGNEVWGLPWNANPALGYPGLSYCVGGRSVGWGGWSPRLLDSETTVWPASVLADLNAKKLPNGDVGYFRQAGQQIGVTATNDFIFGELHNALREQLFAALRASLVSDAMDLNALPEAPPVEIRDGTTTLADLADLLGLALPNPLPTTPGGLKQLEEDLRNKLKLEAPLAVQARPEHAGFFPLNKFSTVPLLIKAVRGAQSDSGGDDVIKRLMVVPRCHVTRLGVVKDPDGRRVDAVLTERGPVPVSPDAKIIVALGTIESTHLALLSLGPDGKIGSNLIAHLRSNLDIRVPREALASLSPTVQALQSSALFLKGEHRFTRADGTEDGTVGHFHVQITASGLGKINANSEAELFQKIPDVDTVNQHLHASDTHVVITMRGIGEMQPDNPNSNVTLDLNPAQVDYGERKAFVNLQPSAKDMQLWDAMDRVSDDLAHVFAGGRTFEVFTPQGIKNGTPADDLKTLFPYTAKNDPDPAKRGRRDALGTTHHDAGTLRMGTDRNTSVTDPNC